MLEFTAGKGFYSNSLRHTHLKLGEGCAGRVAMERKMLNVPDLSQHPTDFNRSPQFHNEHFIAYYGVPLMAKGRVLGVLEIFHRSPLHPDTDWQDFLVMIAGQAAIAIAACPAIMTRKSCQSVSGCRDERWNISRTPRTRPFAIRGTP
jgi:signal transduction protein with GAF and PtsI domain